MSYRFSNNNDLTCTEEGGVGSVTDKAGNVTVCGVTPMIELHMLNGTSAEIAIPCSYVIDGALAPIALVEEGYSDPFFAIDDYLEGLNWSSSMDSEDESVIRLVLYANCPEAIDEDVARDFSLLITRTLSDGTDRTDSVIRGQLLIVASPIQD